MDRALAAGRQDAFDAQFQRGRVPASASSTAFLVQRLGFAVEQWLAARLLRLRAPAGRPAGFPDCPRENGRPRAIGRDLTTSI